MTDPLAGSKIYDDAVNFYRKTLDKFDCLLSAIEVRKIFSIKKNH